MPDILLPMIALLTGFILLIWSADAFTENGAKIANIFKVSPLVIGLLIFGFGTSAPEMLISGLAAINGNTGISIGNAIGSNIVNIALVLGISAIIKPIKVKAGVLKKEWVFLVFATIVTGFLLWDKHLGVLDGLVLIALFIIFLSNTFISAKNSNTDKFDALITAVDKNQTRKIWLMLIIGLVVLIASAKLIVWGGVAVAVFFGVPDFIIGLSVIALGTSLPELAVSIANVLKKQYEMVIGNVIGSNVFNTIVVLAIPGLIHPSKIANEVINRDYPVMLLLTLLLLLLSYKLHKRHRINRFSGIILVSIFSIYLWQLF